MSTVREYLTPNRLTRFVSASEGMTVAEAVAQADANLAQIKPPSLERIDELLAALGPRAPEAASPAEVARLYALADELAGAAPVFGLVAFGRAAFSLCELLDAFAAEGGWTASAVKVHLDGLRLLRHEEGGASSPTAAAVLAGLEQVVQRFAPTPGR